MDKIDELRNVVKNMKETDLLSRIDNDIRHACVMAAENVVRQYYHALYSRAVELYMDWEEARANHDQAAVDHIDAERDRYARFAKALWLTPVIVKSHLVRSIKPEACYGADIMETGLYRPATEETQSWVGLRMAYNNRLEQVPVIYIKVGAVINLAE